MIEPRTSLPLLVILLGGLDTEDLWYSVNQTPNTRALGRKEINFSSQALEFASFSFPWGLDKSCPSCRKLFS